MISVVIPAYNTAEHIVACLDSVYLQKDVDYEVLVIDDGSDDNLLQTIEAQNYPANFHYFSQHNSGAAAARNNAIQKAQGNYIAFLDADDEWVPGKLSKQLMYLQKNKNVGLCFCDMMHIVNGTKIHNSYLHEREYKHVSSGWIYEKLLRECFIFTPTVLVRRDVLQKVGDFNEALHIAEDYDLWLRIADHYEIGFIDEPLTIRNRHQKNLTSNLPLYLDSSIKQMEAVLDVNRGNKTRVQIIKNRLSQQYFELGYHLAKQHRQNAAQKSYIKSLSFGFNVASIRGLCKSMVSTKDFPNG